MAFSPKIGIYTIHTKPLTHKKLQRLTPNKITRQLTYNPLSNKVIDPQILKPTINTCQTPNLKTKSIYHTTTTNMAKTHHLTPNKHMLSTYHPTIIKTPKKHLTPTLPPTIAKTTKKHITPTFPIIVKTS